MQLKACLLELACGNWQADVCPPSLNPCSAFRGGEPYITSADVPFHKGCVTWVGVGRSGAEVEEKGVW